MLNFLAIENIVLIKKAKIEFGLGLNILSGETGSGKSILLDSLGLAIGFRSNSRLIKQGQNSAKVVAEFDVKNNEKCQEFLQDNSLQNLEDKNSLIIRRTINTNSSKNITNKIFVNDNPIGVNLLSKIGELLVEIHGQHDQRGLMDEKSHINILDDFAKNNELLKNLEKKYHQIRQIQKQLQEIKDKKEENAKEKDYLEYVIEELEKANITPGEEQELVEKKDKFNAKEKNLKFLNEFNQNLNEASLSLVNAQKNIIRNSNIIENFLDDEDLDFDNISNEIDLESEKLDKIINQVEDKIRDLNNFDENFDEINERLLEIRSLAKKFNVSVDDLGEIIEKSKDNLDKIQNDFAAEETLTLDLSKMIKQYYELAQNISDNRKKAAKILEQRIDEELSFLKMASAKFKVEIKENYEDENNDKKISINGFDKVKFLASLNKNNFDNIAKIASGGELSRFMLAIKVALMNVRSTPTIIFDEIDTGIGGNTADAVGKRLKNLSQNLQILVVTHQAQIAAKSDIHFKISKNSQNDETKTQIDNLDSKQKEQEIARMLSGEQITNEALMAAQKLISNK